MGGPLKQLGIDETVAYQFFLFLCFYLILSKVLFQKVLFVLKLREQKTSGLEAQADQVILQEKELAKKYEEKISQARRQAQQEYHKKHQLLVEEQKNEVAQRGKKLFQDFLRQQDDLAGEVQGKKQVLLSRSSFLAKDFVSQLIK